MKLKSCPFCGGTRIKTLRLSDMLARATTELDFYKHCEDCNARGPLGVRPTSADALWNDRIADPNPTDLSVAVQSDGPRSLLSRR